MAVNAEQSEPSQKSEDSEPLGVLRSRRPVVGALIAGLLLTVALMMSIAYRHGFFTPKAQVWFDADTAQGIASGTTVRLSGVRVGSVESLVLRKDATVRVTLSIDAETFTLLRRDARAELIREQLQPPAIELKPGKAEAALDEADAHVTFGRRPSFTEITQDLQSRITPVLDDIRQVSSVLRERRSDIDGVIANAATMSKELAGTAQALRAMATDLGTQVAALTRRANGAVGQAGGTIAKVGGTLEQANHTVAGLNAVVQRADRGVAMVNESLPVLLRRLEHTLEQVDQVTRDLQVVSGSVATRAPQVMQEVPRIVDDTRDLVGAARSLWPLRDRLPAPPAIAPPTDSHDAGTLLRLPAR